MKKITIFIGLALLLILCATPVYAIPALPHAFYGTVSINGSPAPVGTSVEARGTGVRTGIAGNPITVTEAGKYGGPGALDPKLAVQGDILSGATITFYVTNPNGTAIGGTATFAVGGGPTPKNLSVTITRPERPDVGEGDVGPRTYYPGATFFGIEGRFLIDSEGKILKTIKATSADGNLTITILKGTIALDKDGNPLSTLTAAIDPSPPPPPEGAYIIGLAYDFDPEGATFDPPLAIEYTYDPDEVPEGVAEEDLVIAFYDEDAGEWVECPCTVDTETLPIYQNPQGGVHRTTEGSLEGTVDATNNWWGNASGPADAVKLAATGYTAYGDSVSADVDYEPWLLAVVTEVTPTTYDKTLALKDGFTLVSTNKDVIAGTTWVGTNDLSPEDPGTVITVMGYGYKLEGGVLVFGGASATDLEPVSALYVKTDGGGGVGIDYSTGAPTVSEKTLLAGWNLISSATTHPANAILSPLAVVQIGDEIGPGLATFASQGGYNQHTGSHFRPTLSEEAWLALSFTLCPFDGYWIYMNAGKSFGVIPD